MEENMKSPFSSISERTLLCRATKTLLRRAIKKINEDEKNIFPMMLLLHRYIYITYNKKEQAVKLRTLINAELWETLKEETKK